MAPDSARNQAARPPIRRVAPLASMRATSFCQPRGVRKFCQLRRVRRRHRAFVVKSVVNRRNVGNFVHFSPVYDTTAQTESQFSLVGAFPTSFFSIGSLRYVHFSSVYATSTSFLTKHRDRCEKGAPQKNPNIGIDAKMPVGGTGYSRRRNNAKRPRAVRTPRLQHRRQGLQPAAAETGIIEKGWVGLKRGRAAARKGRPHRSLLAMEDKESALPDSSYRNGPSSPSRRGQQR